MLRMKFTGQKRLRRQAKFLSNFVLYTMLKKSNFNDRMDQIQETYRLLEELKEKKTRVLESINNKALHKAKQLSLKDKVISTSSNLMPVLQFLLRNIH